jgi:hypothetical protein
MRGLGTPSKRGSRLSLAAAAATALSLGVAAPVFADGPVVMTAPYDSADHVAYCFGTCTATANADASTGEISFSLSATADAPGVGDNANAQGHSQVLSSYVLAVPTGSVTYSVAVHLSSASVGFSGPVAGGAYAESNVYITSDDGPCANAGCMVSSGGTLLSSSNGSSSSMSSQDLTYTYTLVNQSGGDLPPGQLTTTVGIAGNAGLVSGDVGTESSSADATVTSITLTVAPPLSLIGTGSGQYIGGIADAGYPFSSPSQGAGVSCSSPLASEGIGMVCLAIPAGAASVDVSIADAVSSQPAALLAFWTASGGSAGSGGLVCAGTGTARVPAGAAWVAVYLNEASLTTPCSPAPTPATTGTVTARFYS